MKQIAAILLAGIILVPAIASNASGRIARASGLQSKSVSLDSLAPTNSDAIILSPTNAGHYRGTTLTHGVQLKFDLATEYHAEFHLDNKYSTLSGTAYGDDINNGSHGTFNIYDSGDPNHKKLLFNAKVEGNGLAPFKVNVSGVNFLYLEYALDCCNIGAVDVVGTLESGTTPPTQVLPRYPTNNAGVPANSKVLVGWQPFPGATNYLFHVWIVNADASAALTAKTPLAFSATVYHSTKYTWDDTGFPIGTYQYALLPLNDKGKALAGWSTPTQITIAS